MGVFSFYPATHFHQAHALVHSLYASGMAGCPLVQHGLAEFHHVQALMNHGHAIGGSFGFGRGRGGNGAAEAGKQQQRQEVGGGFDGWF